MSTNSMSTRRLEQGLGLLCSQAVAGTIGYRERVPNYFLRAVVGLLLFSGAYSIEGA